MVYFLFPYSRVLRLSYLASFPMHVKNYYIYYIILFCFIIIIIIIIKDLSIYLSLFVWNDRPTYEMTLLFCFHETVKRVSKNTL